MQDWKGKVKQMKNRLVSTDFFCVFGSAIINQFIGFFSNIFLVRILSKGEYGIYSFAYNIVSFFLIFNGLGSSSAMLQYCTENDNKTTQQKYYAYACYVGVLFDVGLTIILVMTALFVPFEMPGVRVELLFMSLLPVATLIYQLKTTYLRGVLRTKEYAYVNTTNMFFTFVLSVAGAFILQEKGLALGQGMAYIVTALGMRVYCNLPLSFQRNGLSKFEKQGFLKFAITTTLINSLSNLLGFLDIFILGVLIPDSSMIASYKVATTIPLALNFIPNTIVIYIYPYFARNKENKSWLREHYKILMYAVGGVNLLITVLLVGLSPFIIDIIFGKKYIDAIVPFCILSCSYFVHGTFYTISSNLLATQRKLKFNFCCNLAMAILNLVGNLAFISMWGATGAAISTLSVEIIGGFAVTWKMFVTIHKMEESRRI